MILKQVSVFFDFVFYLMTGFAVCPPPLQSCFLNSNTHNAHHLSANGGIFRILSSGRVRSILFSCSVPAWLSMSVIVQPVPLRGPVDGVYPPETQLGEKGGGRGAERACAETKQTNKKTARHWEQWVSLGGLPQCD